MRHLNFRIRRNHASNVWSLEPLMDHALYDTQLRDIARRIVFSSDPENFTRVSLLLTILGEAAS